MILESEKNIELFLLNRSSILLEKFGRISKAMVLDNHIGQMILRQLRERYGL